MDTFKTLKRVQFRTDAGSNSPLKAFYRSWYQLLTQRQKLTSKQLEEFKLIIKVIMRKVRISKYLKEMMPNDSVTNQTVINWIKSGQLRGEKRGGLWLVFVEEQGLNTLDLVTLLEAS